MRLSDNRYEAIKQIVVRLFEDYNVCSTPISGFEIANRMGISVIPYSAFPPSKRNLFMQHSEEHAFQVCRRVEEMEHSESEAEQLLYNLVREEVE